MTLTITDLSRRVKYLFKKKMFLTSPLISEAEAFERESSLLWRTSLNKRPFVSLSRGEMQTKLKDEKKDMAEERRK